MQLPYPIRMLGHRAFGHISVRIRRGVNRGKRWSVVALGRGYGSGSFGRDRLAALQVVTCPGDTFWDVGAHKGFVTLAAADMVGPTGHVIALEPSTTNLRFLRRHLEWNAAGNVTVVPVALGDTRSQARFGGTGSSIAFRLGEGSETVEVTTGDRLVTRDGLPRPHVIKIDVEGAEAAVLRGMNSLLGGDQALLISTHDRPLYEECRAHLLQRGFRVFDSWQVAHRLRTGAPWTSDHDLLAIGESRDVPARLGELDLLAGPA